MRVTAAPVRRILTATLVLLAVAAGRAGAEESGSFLDLPDAAVAGIMDLARQHLGRARLRDGSPVPPETPQDLARPILPLAEGRLVVEAGMVSGLARWCGLDWEARNYFPLMGWQRAREIWTDKQLAYIGLLHGVSMGVAHGRTREAGACPDDHRRQLEDWIAARW